MSYTPKHYNPYYDAASEQRRRVRRGLVALGITLLTGGLVTGAVAVTVTQLARQPQVSASPSPSLTSQRPGDSAGSDTNSAATNQRSSDSTSAPGASPSDSPAPQTPGGAQVQGCDGTVLTSPAAGRLSSQDLRATFEKVGRDTGATISVAWFDPTSSKIETAGSAQAWVAWSTSKVPVSVAVSQAGKAGAMAGSMSAALRHSDNGAAEALWKSLGTNDAARAQATTQVLRQTGDNSTTVPSTRLRSGFTVFGQTPWTTASQVGFMMKLPCLAGSGPVVSNMGQVSGDQRWGMGRLPGATFKGGWGPGVSGGYLVRQMGWYQNSEGKRVPLAIAAQAGSFEGGIGVLNKLVAAVG
ncbi:hypothetical protein [Mobiluncus curtisii]|uniref:Uncharacterized protein n=1 Tax=Mobiluncus curtisii TaxID=2051 RepID=A0A7Y0YCN7_9ACTO|nr:hypothetical protein [Mobiluncus curtisii]MCU9987628.1 hypothetical protein [Mobiluncus curtisii]MCV0000690.1 hypothetical protein [Mobiluncus curtisii]NMW43273.1 hypothetical protein [Mobiluncus curtisii]NMW48515.1 hypothetical protein [Mobiluncus curtisii]NMW82783.1 hypothetical protein [Mobiluncus curtisii]